MKKITLLLLLITSLSSAQVLIGSGDDGDGFNSPPISPYYGYSFSQSIYLASEIGTSGDITSIEYALNTGSDFSTADDNVDVWIGHTAKTAFDTTADWVDVSSLTHVLIDGTVTVANDILTITFSSPFTYNGTDNLVVAIDANESGYGSSSDYVLSTNGPTAGLTLDQKSDTTNSDPTEPATGTLRQNRGNITFNGITQSCPTPTNLEVTFNSTTEVQVSWTAGASETEWTYEYGPTGFTQGDGIITITGPNNTITLGGLSGSYDIYVQANCAGTNGDSAWISISWTMPPVNDTMSGAIPITPNPQGTGCNAAQFTLNFSTDGTTDSGMDGTCNTTDTGLDQFFTWTATTEGLLWNDSSPGNPGIIIRDTAGNEIACAETFATDNTTLSGWDIGDDLIIQIYDFGTSVSDVAFCLEEYTPPAPIVPNYNETFDSFSFLPDTWTEASGAYGTPTGSSGSFAGDDFINDASHVNGQSARINIYGSSIEEYLISPLFNLSGGTYYLNYDIALTEWNDTTSATLGSDDYLALLVTQDGGSSWQELSRWDASTEISNEGQSATEFTLSGYGSEVQFAFYANSGSSDSGIDNDLFIDNFQITTATLGTATNTLEGFTLYPTIVKEELNFRSHNNVEAITVFNLLGQKVFSGAPNTNNSSINLSKLRPGMYVVKVSAEGKIGSYKIIKE